MSIFNEEWCWDSTQNIYLTSFPIAFNRNTIAVLASYYKGSSPVYDIVIMSKNFKRIYRVFQEPLLCRTVWELECQKSYLISLGFKINWENYQLILNEYSKRFKEYSPYL